jgi:hypothetical protein
LGGRGRRSEFDTSLGKVNQTLSQKQIKNKRARDIVQVVEHLPGKHKALGSLSKSTKTKTKAASTKPASASWLCLVLNNYIPPYHIELWLYIFLKCFY